MILIPKHSRPPTVKLTSAIYELDEDGDLTRWLVFEVDGHEVTARVTLSEDYDLGISDVTGTNYDWVVVEHWIREHDGNCIDALEKAQYEGRDVGIAGKVWAA